MSDVKPWEAREGSASGNLHISDDGIYLFTVGVYRQGISQKSLHTILHAPVYEAIVRELAILPRLDEIEGVWSQVASLAWMRRITEIQERAHAALGVETEE